MRAHLQAIGVDDLPRNGALILTAVDSSGGPRQDLPRLAVTRGWSVQTVDALGYRGYLETSPDPDDRRRVVLELTDRGEEVVEATMRGIDAVDRQLAERVSAEQVEAMRAGLVALTEIKSRRVVRRARRRQPPGPELQSHLSGA